MSLQQNTGSNKAQVVGFQAYSDENHPLKKTLSDLQTTWHQ